MTVPTSKQQQELADDLARIEHRLKLTGEQVKRERREIEVQKTPGSPPLGTITKAAD